ncbi:aldehyde dehydrogenase family protein [Mycobacterium aquaticum]|uniref:Putative succinate-semialdehyde dehydrogenase [NADP(+)] 2 n=1 Tax=Mycobacterium aquaticum TaxID=1927124 RepID=A0A1X0B9Z4_9MYCO|nr:aldehyde dehydrogenase family protein [Mycobacterium aquaticum]ORA39171.1 sorbosone dehydrogenase [Mycobacterium aquaticum]
MQVDNAVRSYGLHINGHESPPGTNMVDRHSPATGRLVARYVAGTVEDARAAVEAARTAFDTGTWPHLSGQDRSRILNRLAALTRRDAEQLARIEAEETGKPLRLARGDVAASIGLTEYAAALALTMHGDVHTNLGPGFTGLVTREPAGVVGMITPWNFPLLLLMQKLPFALAAGCTAVAKPAEVTSGTTLEIARLTVEAGVPAGVFNVVTGRGSVVGQHLAESEHIDVLSFTGSTSVGQRIIQASGVNSKRLSMELGGKAATIVFPDADLTAAVDGVLFGVFFNQGECCVSGARLLVHQDIADEFLSAVVSRARELAVGHPLDEDSDIGALIHAEHLETVLNYVNIGRQHGARVLLGGARLDSPELRDGFFFAPTILDEVTPQNPAFQEEIFGPVLTVTRFGTTEEAIGLANSVEYGLANTVWSKNIDTALTVGRALHSGTVWINTTIDGAPQLPGGGVKNSGYGREMGQVGFDEFTEVKTIQIRTGQREPFFR